MALRGLILSKCTTVVYCVSPQDIRLSAGWRKELYDNLKPSDLVNSSQFDFPEIVVCMGNARFIVKFIF